MWQKISAYIAGASAVLGAAALGGYAVIVANAGTVPGHVSDPRDEITGQQASCYAVCGQGIWPTITTSNVKELCIWRRDGVVTAYANEATTEDEDVFAALDKAAPSVVVESDGCPIVVSGTDVTFCVKHGPIDLDAAQIACVKACTTPIIPSLKTITYLRFLRGPPITLDVKREADLSTHDYAVGRAAGTVAP